MTSNLIYFSGDFDSAVQSILDDEDLAFTGLTKTKVSKTLKSFQGDLLASSVFLKKYALRDNNNKILEITLSEAKDRWAEAVAKVDTTFANSKGKKYFRELYDYFLPAGRQMMGLGNDYVKNISYSNCYVLSIEEDSIEGIFDAAKETARTFSYGGGVGLDIGVLRPNKSKVSNSAKSSTGSVSFMDLYSLTSGLIGQFSRRGALILTMPVDHPDIEEFVEVKHNNIDKVRYANISVKITDDFMLAVVNDEDFNISFSTPHETTTKVVRARELWKKITQSARDSAEPGILFWDRMVEKSPSDTYDELKIVGVNPCSEQCMESGSACVLSSVVLPAFVSLPFTDNAVFDIEMFREIVRRGVRHLDNVVEMNIEKHPLQKQKDAAEKGRRIGLGVTGLADVLSSLCLKFDSEEALLFVRKIMAIKMEEEYLASIELAKERGSFPLFDGKKHYERGFCSGLPEYVKEAGRKHGQRNVAISTVAPNGSLSIIAQCSSGIEPIFMFSYDRFVELGSERKKFVVQHPGYARFRALQPIGRTPSYFVEAHEVDYIKRIDIQAAVQEFTDASISSTINLPANTTTEVVSNLYIEAWKRGLKGLTVYREGSREGILVASEKVKAGLGNEEMDTTGYSFLAEGNDKFHILVSYEKGDLLKPYQVFVLNYNATERDSFVKMGNLLIRMLRDYGVKESRIQKHIERSNNSLNKLARFLSLAMKEGYFTEALEILNEFAFVGTLASKICNIFKANMNNKGLKCQACGSKNVRSESGCHVCLDCGTDMCGG